MWQCRKRQQAVRDSWQDFRFGHRLAERRDVVDALPHGVTTKRPPDYTRMTRRRRAQDGESLCRSLRFGSASDAHADAALRYCLCTPKAPTKFTASSVECPPNVPAADPGLPSDSLLPKNWPPQLPTYVCSTSEPLT